MAQQPSATDPFFIKLLFAKKQNLPTEERILEVLGSHFGELEGLTYSENGAGAVVLDWEVDVGEQKVAPMVQIFASQPHDVDAIGPMVRNQMWDVFPNADAVLESLPYEVAGTDFLGSILDPQTRANFEMTFLDAMLELFPDADAVLFFDTGRLMRVDDVRAHEFEGIARYIRLAMNVRVFSVDDDEWLVDTLGMHKLGGPDMQYHFRGLSPEVVAGHATAVAEYQLANNFPIENGNSVQGLSEDEHSDDPGDAVMWHCRYEDALIGPERVVLDIEAGEFAAGNRQRADDNHSANGREG